MTDKNHAIYAVQHLELWLQNCSDEDRPGFERAMLRFRGIAEMEQARESAEGITVTRSDPHPWGSTEI